MRMMLKMSFPVEKANVAIKEGRLPKILQDLMAELKPEAAYFTTQDGLRTGFVFFDMKETAQMPSIAEPLYMGLNASLELTPVMNADDLKAGLERAAKKF